ncbi:MAG: Mur ligase domain-containing protein [Puniceicoccales bacterium]|jgi:UDP-N-acetylmuramate: L-alanyl-gamma-D-glutamyl-meso-diaminopimelate ligase|nr:Mur ligase domain-containing protein [Puniceicoccales bacterium]
MKIYFMGIGGVGMGNAAILARQRGHAVAGSDGKLYPPMDGLLRRSGIEPWEGSDVARLEAFAPDLAVVGNAIARGVPEMEWLLNTRRFPFLSLPDFLFRHFLANRHRIVVAGTHGKTTTSACAAFYLRQLGIDAGYLIGGAPIGFPAGASGGDPAAPFVIEGDEYDCAFFDKRSKFVHYAPDTLIINKIDFDHADIFRDLADVQRTFSHLLRTVPGRGRVFLNGDDPNAEALLPCPWTEIARVGLAPHCDFRLHNFAMDGLGSHWEVDHGGGTLSLESELLGEFNARNVTMAVLAVHAALATPLPERVDLRAFQGVHRRQEKLRETENWVVYEDFGHHPRAVGEVLQTLRLHHGDCELTACFEPATNTSMRRVLQREFSQAFTLCDRCLLGVPRKVLAIPEAERLSQDEMVQFLRAAGVDAHCFSDNALLQLHLLEVLSRPADRRRVVVLFSNGAFPGVLSAWRDDAANGS